MPIDYSKYPKNWRSEIRPRIMARAGEIRNLTGGIEQEARCELCGVENHSLILRGEYGGKEVYQDMDGWIYDANTSKKIDRDYLGEVDLECKNKVIKVVLTVMHLDHDPENKNVKDERLKAGCQRCHLLYDQPMKQEKRRKKKYKNSLFPI